MATQEPHQEPRTEASDDVRDAGPIQEAQIVRPKRLKLSGEEALRRMEAFETERMAAFIAHVRKSRREAESDERKP